MAFPAQTYRVLIASPSDLAEEREAATAAINEWNAQHSAAEGIVLLTVRWETHATPTTGVRPQAALNKQLVADSDILVGMFWTRLGTSTGVADSGTLEEIDQFVAAGKPAMLYFSRRPIDPDKIDMKQHRKLREFKESTRTTALTGEFNSIATLRDALLRNLTETMRGFPAYCCHSFNRSRASLRYRRIVSSDSGMPSNSKSDTISPTAFDRLSDGL